MKFKYLLIAVLAGAALVGCNKEAGSDSNELKPSGESNYMGFTISMPAATKAAGTGSTGTYVVGEDYENAIKTLHFFFYRNGAYVSWGYGDVTGRFTNETAGAADANVEESRHGTTAAKGVVVLESTMAMPDQVLCVVNSRNAGWYRNKSLAQVQAAIHSGTAESLTGNTTDSYKDFQAADGGNPYFVMFTSPMYSATDGVKYATDIYVEQDASGNFTAGSYIQSSITAAENKPLDIYVERMAARAEIDNLNASGVLDADGFFKAANLAASMKDGSGNPLYDIAPIAWALTAQNKKAYSIKQIDAAWFPDATYNTWLQSGDQVPNPAKPSELMYTRINWTKDPNYSTGQIAFANRQAYPHSARQYYAENEEKYWSATQIKAHYDAAEKSEGDILQRYCYENTFDKDGQTSPRINGTMLLLYAQAKKHGAANYEDLFAYMGQTETYAEYAAHLLSTMAAHGSDFYTKDGSTYKAIHTDPNFADKSKNYLKIVKAATMNDFYGGAEYGPYQRNVILTNSAVDPSKKIDELYMDWIVDMGRVGTPITLQLSTYDSAFPTIPAPPTASDEKGYADGYVTLVPDTAMPQLYVIDTNTTTNPAYDAGTLGSEYRAATNAEIVKGFLGSVVEPANMYRDGKLYYAIPLEHFGKAVDNPTDKNPLEGNYGVVRNNLYKVSIGTVNNLGHGIDDVDEPIIPGDRKKPFYLAAKINILSWQIAAQTANLEE